MGYFIGLIIWGIIWGYATKTVNETRGYEGGFWLGFFLGFIGLIIVACKSKKSYTDYVSSTLLSAASQEANDKKVISNGGWKCSKCGRVNPSYTGTCACGGSKYETEAKEKADAEEAKARENSEKEFLELQKLKTYKDLLDSGVITQEEFDLKKKQLLGL